MKTLENKLLPGKAYYASILFLLMLGVWAYDRYDFWRSLIFPLYAVIIFSIGYSRQKELNPDSIV